MNEPFIYPKSKHSRLKIAKIYKSYRSYKKLLQGEFAGQCIYCRMPDSLIGYKSFGVDHYRPKEHFPELTTSYPNLFYCCNACNSYKGSAWTGNERRFVPNPVDHVMYSHLRFKGPKISFVSDAGEYTHELLNLDEDTVVAYRENVIHTIDVLENEVKDLDQAEANARLKIAKKEIDQRTGEEIFRQIAQIRLKSVKALKMWRGTFP